MRRVASALSLIARYLVAVALVALGAPLVLLPYLFLALLGALLGPVLYEGLELLGLGAGAAGEFAFAAAGYLLMLGLLLAGVAEEVRDRVAALAADGTEPPPDHPVVETVDRLAHQVGMPAPAVVLLPDRTPEAFSLRREGRPTVVVSEGLVELLPPAELEAVLAHELAHVRNADFRLMSGLLYAVVAADTFYDPESFDAASVGDWAFRGHAKAASVLPRAAAGTVGRGREFAADRGAAAITGDPAALASALERLAGRAPPTRDAREAFASANVVPLYEPDGALARFTGTHPETEERIERLRAMAGEQ